MSETVLIVGAGSGIGRAVARHAAARGARLVLAARDRAELDRVGQDCQVRWGAPTAQLSFDALDFASHPAFVRRAEEAFPGGLDGVIVCHGLQVEQQAAQDDPELARRMLEVNAASVVSLLEPLACSFAARGSGFLCAVSSVAGDRGRASNYLYGMGKAALNAYLDGLRARLARSGVKVVCVRPGFVDTRLTFGRPGVAAAASPERVAADLWRGIRRGRRVVYSPFFWRPIMAVIRAIPDPIFERSRW